MMEINPAKRLTAKEALMHPWILQKVKTKYDKNLIEGSLNNLMEFTAESKLKQASLTFMVTHLSTKKEQQKLKEAFA